MPLKAFPPGTRRNNRTYIFRGSIAGYQREITTTFTASTPTRTIRLALQRAEQRILADDAERRIPGPAEEVSFARAAALYAAYRKLDLQGKHPDAKRLNRLIDHMGGLAVAAIKQAQLVEAAQAICPDKGAATQNREIMRPAAAVLHYAADNDYCPWLRVKLFREPRPKPRSIVIDQAAKVVAAAPAGLPRLFLLWSFHVGTRISETLKVAWSDIDLNRQVATLRLGKTDEWKEAVLHPELFEALAAIPEQDRAGRLFPWGDKSNVYRWLRPLTKQIGVTFTPHMARHSLGTWLNNGGEGLATIMGALRHHDAKSSIRYQSPDLGTIRAAIGKLPRLAAGEQTEQERLTGFTGALDRMIADYSDLPAPRIAAALRAAAESLSSLAKVVS